MVLVINYSRSGGTLLSSVLGCLNNVVLVSEVNPNGNAYDSIFSQVADWYGIKIANSDFTGMANELAEYGSKAGKNIVVRDYSFIDFTPHQLNHFSTSNKLSNYESLSKSDGLKTFAFVRNVFDVWISRGCPPKFSAYYLNYVEAILAAKIPIFKFEEFCKNSKEELKSICDYTGLKYSEEALVNSHKFEKVTGDIQITKTSRGRLMQEIKPLKRKQLPQALIKMAMNDPLLRKANRLLGYSEDYMDFEFETHQLQWKIELVWRIKKTLRRWPKDVY